MVSSSVRKFLGMVACLAAIPISVGAEPDSDLVARLGAEAFPQRVAAEAELARWASVNGVAAEDWLVRRVDREADPEVRSRLMSILRAKVLARLTAERPAYVGIMMRTVRIAAGAGGGFGVQVVSIEPGTPAEEGGLRPGDVVVRLDGRGWPGKNAEDEFAGKIGRKRAGDKVRLQVLRAEEKLELDVVLKSRPFSAGEYGGGEYAWAGEVDPFAADPAVDDRQTGEDQAKEQRFQEWLGQRKQAIKDR